MRSEQILAFRFARSGLGERETSDMASAVDCPASDFARDAALTAIAARANGVDRAAFDDCVDRGSLVMMHAMRGSIHVVAPEDSVLFGRLLVAEHDDDLARQLGHAVGALCDEHRIRLIDALTHVTAAVRDALHDGRRLGKNELHEELRGTVREELLPWCEGCKTHHVPGMLWRYATIGANARLDADRRYLLGDTSQAPPAHEAVHRYLRWYGPATPAEFSTWAGVSPRHGRRLWDEVSDELVEVVDPDGHSTWVLEEDLDELTDPPPAKGVRLLPPGDPFLWKPNRTLLAPDDAVRKQLFRPVSSPGGVIHDGQLVGMWRARARRGAVEVDIDPIGRIPKSAVHDEAQRLAELRGAGKARVTMH